MSAKERFKAGLLIFSLLTIGFLGNFHLLLFENADAQGGSIRQWSVTWTEERVKESTDKGVGTYACTYCGKSRLARRYYVTVEDYEVTVNYLYDGNMTLSMTSERKLGERTGNVYFWLDHLSGSGSECGG